jgi:hypothetical protein
VLTYYAVYREEAGTGPPAGLIVLEQRTGDALMWNHQTGAWRYDPALAIRWLDDPENWDRFKTISRAEAEQVTMVVTRATEALPDEDTIRWLFQTRGNPPNSSDPSDPPE